jgi:hypothetical protein
MAFKSDMSRSIALCGGRGERGAAAISRDRSQCVRKLWGAAACRLVRGCSHSCRHGAAAAAASR